MPKTETEGMVQPSGKPLLNAMIKAAGADDWSALAAAGRQEPVSASAAQLVQEHISASSQALAAGDAPGAQARALDALLGDRRSGAAWYAASKAFAAQDAAEAAGASLKLALYFAKNRPQAAVALTAEEKSGDDPKFKSAAQEALAALATMPPLANN